MNKKVAVILKNFEEAPENSGSFRGAVFYILNFITSLSLISEVDIFCETNKPLKENSRIKNIFNYSDENPLTTERLNEDGYDFVWNLTKNELKKGNFLTFTLQHSHSRIFRQKYIRRNYELFIKRIFNPSRYYTKNRIEEYKKTFKQTDILFANSKIAKDDYVNLCGIKEEEVPVINPMIKIPENISRKEHEVYTFGMSALTFDLKGGYLFLEALHKLKKTNKNFRAKIIYPHFNKNFFLRFFVIYLGLKKYVEFLDYQKNMEDFYGSVDCIVMPSREETFGFVAAEGMAHKLPVVVSNFSGICDIIEDNQNGFIFDIRKNPVNNLCQALSKVLTAENLEQVAQRAYETVLKNSLEEHSKKLDKILDDFLKNRREQKNEHAQDNI